ncbi:hypothetical protein ACFQ10_45245 [Streptomyces indonesiensis]
MTRASSASTVAPATPQWIGLEGLQVLRHREGEVLDPRHGVRDRVEVGAGGDRGLAVHLDTARHRAG